jgi:hypothetical protein
MTRKQEQILCKCGCGITIDKFDSRGRERKYLNSHQRIGIPHTSKSLEKMRLIKIGKKASEETKKKMRSAIKEKFTNGTMKPNLWNKGLTKETDERVARNAKAISKSAPRGEQHRLWKGNDVRYRALHSWIVKTKPKTEVCEQCNGLKKLVVANISGKYLRDPDDYKWLCYKCHARYDGVPSGEEARSAKIKNKDVIEIINCLNNKEMIIDIAKKFSVSTALISNIKHGRAWSHISGITYLRGKNES